jgi:hypothetical protein
MPDTFLDGPAEAHDYSNGFASELNGPAEADRCDEV